MGGWITVTGAQLAGKDCTDLSRVDFQVWPKYGKNGGGGMGGYWNWGGRVG